MTTYKHETEARIIMDALTAGLPGKGNGTLAPDMAALRYTMDSKPTILVALVNGTIVAKTDGLSASEGGFLFTQGADEEGARQIAARIVAWVNSH
jgi:hypothetical protein